VDGGVLAGRSRVEKQFSISSGFGRDIGGLTFQGTPLTFCFSGSRPIVQSISGWTSSNVYDQPGKDLIQLESLILAQSERWRQA
jgi:hypothetical protein